MIQREILPLLQERFFRKKVILLVGARQVGKTTLLRAIAADATAGGRKCVFLNCDEPDTRLQLTLPTSTQLGALTGDADFVFIDEAQRVQDISITLKLIVDTFPEKQVVVSGSSALELSNTINEPLTGRKYDFSLFPFSVRELVAAGSAQTEKRLLETRLVFGTYPDIVNNPGHERELLGELASTYLYKDIFAFQDVRKPALIEILLRALALQVGSEASYGELARTCGINVLTVRRYLDLLEKTYIIFHLPAFSRNIRSELKKSVKFYFYDNGIRNALISNFNPPALRTDTGALWENFLVAERVKRVRGARTDTGTYFWRTHEQQEIDFVEEDRGALDGVVSGGTSSDGTARAGSSLSAYEFKWDANRTLRPPSAFATYYPDAKWTVVTPANYLDFVAG
ncbi:MAG: ATP-binding protein [Puniceicoccales bacterium]|jgi:predicted AAA+ superfamily ATPase|nr:ATP-binding protein [Puniceicoccales bacterium]